MTYRLLVLISGEGTNLQAIIEACNESILDARIVGVISNKKAANGLVRAEKHNIQTYYKPYLSKEISREDYDSNLADFVNDLDFDIIILAGWMHVLGHEFLSKLSNPIINLHPALPGQFPGRDAIKYAYDAFKEGKINHTGIMVHYVVEKIDAGKVVDTMEIPILINDTEESLRKRVRYFEKTVLIHGILKELAELDCNLLNVDNINESNPVLLKQPHRGPWRKQSEDCALFFESQKRTTQCSPEGEVRRCKKMEIIYKGKVRDIYDIGNNMLAIACSDRQSAFDKYLCDVVNKGKILTNVSAWWFEKTKHIINNHYLYHLGNIMIVKKCQPFKVEVVVRGYITGNTETSLWTHYKNGIRKYCGHQFPNDLIKNQKLNQNIVTPTTKDVSDRPISGNEVIELGLMNQEEWDYVERIVLELFEYGQKISLEKGLILVDTKYEFGKDRDGNIILIDEIHTCDSSRYWFADTYQERFNNSLEPDKYDKDVIRDWVRQRCNPYIDKIPKIDINIIEKLQKNYEIFELRIVDDLSILDQEDNVEDLIDECYQHMNINMEVSGITNL